jgi:hypothetical protein
MSVKIKVDGKIQNVNNVEEKNIVKKNRKSSFLLTINLNQSYKDGDQHKDNDAQYFEGVLQNILNDLGSYVKVPPGDWNDDKIKDVNIDFTIETGMKIKMLHAHVLITIEHQTNVKLDYVKMKNKIKNDLQLKNIYFNNRIIKNDGNENVINYINKYVKPKNQAT